MEGRYTLKRPGELERVRIVEGTSVAISLDPYPSLKALSCYSGLSVRTLRGYLTDPVHPLPCYRVGGRVVVRRSEFDQWIARYRQSGRPDVEALVEEMLRDVKSGPNK